MNSKSNVTEFGDRLNKNDICSGVVLLTCIGCLLACGFVRGCQEIKAHSEKGKVPAAQTIKITQNLR